MLTETHGGSSLKEGLIDVLKRETVDYMLIAGDLTSTGSPHEYTHCQNVLRDISSKAGIKSQNIVLVGNHRSIDWRMTKWLKTLMRNIVPHFRSNLSGKNIRNRF